MANIKTVSNPIETAERKSGSILAYAVAVIAIYLIANAAFISGALFLTGSLVIMPRSPLLTKVPTIVGWILVAIGFTTLS